MAEHGTYRRYNTGCRCDDCRLAHAARQTRQNLQRHYMLQNGLVDVEHGEESTYGNWRCRCEACKAAHSAYLRNRRARAKAEQ